MTRVSEHLIGRPGMDPTLKSLTDVYPWRFTAEDGVAHARGMYEALKAFAAVSEALLPTRIADRTVGYGGVKDVPVRIYWPPVDHKNDLPVVVFNHGGGWAIGDLDTHDVAARAHAVGAEAIVVSVDYRLAPEHPFPAAIDDSWAALQWVGEHAAELGGDPRRIAVAGDSAGGNISAVIAQLARDNVGPQLVFQLLWYPSTTIDQALPSMTENADGPIVDLKMIAAFVNWYLPPGMDTSDPAALSPLLAPANAIDLSGLPPAYIATAEYDPLRDDGARYAELLIAAGVPVELHNAPTLIHGYMSFFPFVPAAAEATDRGLSALKTALHLA